MEKDLDIDNPLDCPVVFTLGLISGKWKPKIIHALSEQSMRFGIIKQRMSPISQKVLTQQLRELESTHLIKRHVKDDKILNVTYSLTQYGQSLAPVLDALFLWGETNRVEASA